MQWQDEAIVLSVRRHGEASAVASLFTRRHGRHAGLVRSGFSRRLAPLLQPGNELAVSWQGRLAEQLGSFRVEPVRAHAAAALDQPPRLAALASLAALLEQTLPERAPHQALYEASALLLRALEAGVPWPALYVRWELGLLAEMGFGLDLSACAVSGVASGLAYVSPRSGRAVSAAAAGPYEGRLLALPSFLAEGRGLPPANDESRDLAQGFHLTGFFLARALAERGAALPPARARLLARLEQDGQAAASATFLSPARPGGVEPEA